MLCKMKKYPPILFAPLLGLMIAQAVWADIYSYTDKGGTVHFTNSRPRGKARGKYKVYLKTPPQRKARPGVVPVTARDRDPARYSRYDATIREAARTHSIPETFIRAVIRVESDYDPRVVSVAGAQGLMQLMPDTQRLLDVGNPYDPEENIMGGTRYFKYLLNRFRGKLQFALAGYNAGPNQVVAYNGIPPFRETKNYVVKVMRYYKEYK